MDTQPSLRSTVSAAEWETRVNLAALYRICALFGWDDLIYTHISARVLESDHHFLINPFGLLFEEVTASNLVKIDLEGTKVIDSPHSVNKAGFTIHSAIHEAREDAACVLHLHTDYGVAVSMLETGFIRESQNASIVSPFIAYHDYEGVATREDEKKRLVASLGDKFLMILRNHGTLACTPSIEFAFQAIYILERACKMQILAQSSGQPIQPITDEAFANAFAGSEEVGAAATPWPALIRKLDRLDPGYKE